MPPSSQIALDSAPPNNPESLPEFATLPDIPSQPQPDLPQYNLKVWGFITSLLKSSISQ
jgi:hypothetical protein